MTDTVFTVLHSGQASPAPAVMERAVGSPPVRKETPGRGQAEYADGFDVIGLIHGRRSRSGCRPAHCRRVCLCRRARRCRHSTGAGSRNRAAVWGAISPAAAAQTHAAIIETGTVFVIRLRFLELFGQLRAL